MQYAITRLPPSKQPVERITLELSPVEFDLLRRAFREAPTSRLCDLGYSFFTIEEMYAELATIHEEVNS